jgi:hypothetical protein
MEPENRRGLGLDVPFEPASPPFRRQGSLAVKRRNSMGFALRRAVIATAVCAGVLGAAAVAVAAMSQPAAAPQVIEMGQGGYGTSSVDEPTAFGQGGGSRASTER